MSSQESLKVGDRVRFSKQYLDYFLTDCPNVLRPEAIIDAVTCVGTLERDYSDGNGYVRWDNYGGTGVQIDLLVRVK